MNKENVYKRLCFIIIVIFCLFLMLIVLKVPLFRIGDSAEYKMQVEALLNHASMDIRDEDYLTALPVYGDMTAELYEWNQHPAHNFITDDGRSFAPHFGGYALFCIPAKLLLKTLDVSEYRCFVLTNTVLYCIALITVFIKTCISYQKKLYLLLFLIINPVIFYVPWIHAEVFSFSMIVIGLVHYYNKQHKTAILFISLGSMQNVSLLFLGMVIGLDYWKKILGNEKLAFYTKFIKSIKVYNYDIILTGLCYLPALLPIIHTYINFRKLNLVASVARENDYLFQKALAYWFDLNIGMMPYIPIILLLFFFTMILLIRKNTWYVVMHLTSLIGIYYILANQRQINSGMAGMMRYNVWVIPIMIFAVIYNLDVWKNINGQYLLLSFSAIITMVMMLWSTEGSLSPYGDIEFAPWTKIVLKYVPEIYHPYHGIFITRTIGKEAYATEIPIIYKDDLGYIRKILVPRNNKLLDINVSGSESDIQYFQNKLNNLKETDYQYITIPYSKQIREKIIE